MFSVYYLCDGLNSKAGERDLRQSTPGDTNRPHSYESDQRVLEGVDREASTSTNQAPSIRYMATLNVNVQRRLLVTGL